MLPESFLGSLSENVAGLRVIGVDVNGNKVVSTFQFVSLVIDVYGSATVDMAAKATSPGRP